MLKPQNVLDKLVRRVKTYDDFSSVRFVKGRKSQNAEKPVTSFFVACFVGEVQKEKDVRGNRTFEAKLCFQVYAPFDKGAVELSSLCVSLMDALDRADAEGEVSDIRITPAVYDKDLCTQTQELQAKLLWEVSPAVNEEPAPLPVSDSIEIFVNDKPFKVLSAQATTTDEVYVLRELLCGDTGVVSKGKTYSLEVKVRSDIDPFEFCEKPHIAIKSAEGYCLFRNCFAQKMTEKTEPKNADVRCYSFISLEKKITERNGDWYGRSE